MAADLRIATADDWKAFSDWPVPEHWVGFASDEDGRVAGFGGIYEAVDGRWWAVVKRSPGVTRPLALMRAAKEVLATAGAAGVPVHAIADPGIAGADALLDHLGFRATGETIEGHEVHQWAQR